MNTGIPARACVHTLKSFGFRSFTIPHLGSFNLLPGNGTGHLLKLTLSQNVVSIFNIPSPWIPTVHHSGTFNISPQLHFNLSPSSPFPLLTWLKFPLLTWFLTWFPATGLTYFLIHILAPLHSDLHIFAELSSGHKSDYISQIILVSVFPYTYPQVKFQVS